MQLNFAKSRNERDQHEIRLLQTERMSISSFLRNNVKTIISVIIIKRTLILGERLLNSRVDINWLDYNYIYGIHAY